MYLSVCVLMLELIFGLFFSVPSVPQHRGYRETSAMLHRKAPCTGGTRGWPVPAPPAVPEEGLYLTAPAPWVPELRLYLYRWYGESL